MCPGSSPKSLIVLAVLLAAGNFACAKKTVKGSGVSDLGSNASTGLTTDRSGSTNSDSSSERLTINDVFFDFDQARLRLDAIQVLHENGKAIRQDGGSRLVLEGHCDELGTVEYNLALGEQRARAVQQYLIQSGIESSRLSTISYGEERPFARGSDPVSWAQNRRVHFVKS